MTIPIFISWSGEKSKKLAQCFKDWLPSVIQATKPYFSPEDIEKGSRWNSGISKKLEETKVGLICLTKNNVEAPWIIFEAGALSKSIEHSRVIPILFGLEASDVKGPLAQFQSSRFEKLEIKRIVKTINKSITESQLEEKVLEKVFEKWWPDLEEKINKVLSESIEDDNLIIRSEKEMIEEILDIVRSKHYGYENKVDPVLIKPIDDTQLNMNIINNLKDENIYYIGDLIQRTEQELLACPAINNNNLKEINEVLRKHGLTLGMRLDKWGHL
ncbi:MAG: TIR domain-containing protein [Gammaproteobacteria bacterium]|nr:TIR domain-containing protein [Gammaproteobacteria bacterium]